MQQYFFLFKSFFDVNTKMMSYQKQHYEFSKTVSSSSSIPLQANCFLILLTENVPIKHFLYDQYKVDEDVKLL